MVGINGKSLKEIRMVNCGVDALSKICEIKNISAFSLVHMGRDNGVELSVFKVNNLNDLPKVHRPAIFHQKDHFVHVRNGEVMPEGEYSGYVIGPIVMGRVISLADAKTIKGGKNFFTGKNKDGEQTGHGALGDILAVVAAVVAAPTGPVGSAAAAAAVRTAYGSVERAQNQDVLGSPYDPKALATDALIGAGEGYGAGTLATSIGSAGAATGTSALSNTGTNAAFNAARAGSLINPATSTLSGVASQGAGLSGTIGAFNAANAANISGAANLAGATKAFGGGATSPSSAGTLSSTGAGFSNTAPLNAASNANSFNAANFVPNSSFSLNSVPFTPEAQQQFGLSNITSGVGNGVRKIGTDIGNVASGAGSIASKATGGLVGGASSPINLSTAASLAGAAGVFGSTPPAYNAASPTDNYSAVSQFVGKTPQGLLNSQQGTAAGQQNLDYVNTPIADLQKQFTGNNQRTLDTINTAYDNQKAQLIHQYAQAGQNIANSSEAQDKVSQLEQKRTNDLTLAQQELTDQALGQAIQVKQSALSSSMQAGQWNQSVAMQLASLTGDQQNLQYAIANNDYESFQQIMGKLMTMGIPQTVNIAK